MMATKVFLLVFVGVGVLIGNNLAFAWNGAFCSIPSVPLHKILHHVLNTVKQALAKPVIVLSDILKTPISKLLPETPSTKPVYNSKMYAHQGDLTP